MRKVVKHTSILPSRNKKCVVWHAMHARMRASIYFWRQYLLAYVAQPTIKPVLLLRIKPVFHYATFFVRSDFFFRLIISRLKLIKNLFNFHNSMSLGAKENCLVGNRIYARAGPLTENTCDCILSNAFISSQFMIYNTRLAL